jgi:PIN domain nuclease of toxin-antitoxin system
LKLLLDTNALLWARADSPRLTAHQRKAIADADTVLFSVASAWELAILLRLGRIDLDVSIRDAVRAPRTSVLDIRLDHIECLARLPLIHRDPFDRMLIAQAIVERCAVVTSDRHFDQYEITVVAP